jgi:hypothetical protein
MGSDAAASSTINSDRLASRLTDVERRGGRHVERCQDKFHSRRRCTTGEGGQRPESSLIVGEQQVVAPPDRST